jgi:hypothetical protein
MVFAAVLAWDCQSGMMRRVVVVSPDSLFAATVTGDTLADYYDVVVWPRGASEKRTVFRSRRGRGLEIWWEEPHVLFISYDDCAGINVPDTRIECGSMGLPAEVLELRLRPRVPQQ